MHGSWNTPVNAVVNTPILFSVLGVVHHVMLGAVRLGTCWQTYTYIVHVRQNVPVGFLTIRSNMVGNNVPIPATDSVILVQILFKKTL